MTAEQRANNDVTVQGNFSTEVGFDPELASTVISLAYTDPQEPQRNITISVAPELGSNMFRFRVGEHDLIYCERELLKRKDFTGNFVLWPLPNRIRDKRYAYQGQLYSLADVSCPQGNAVLIHGLVFDQPWQYEQPIITEDSATVVTYIQFTPESPHFDSYPFESRLLLIYQITSERVSVSYQVENMSESDLPFGFALHPYFAHLSGAEHTTITLLADAVWEADEELLPTGRVFDVNKLMYGMYDLRQPVPASYLKLDHVYTKLQKQESAVIDYKQQGLQLHISATDDFTHIVIYTPTGAPSFCLEHQTCATDAINLHNQGGENGELAHLLEVPPGASYAGSIIYTPKFTS